MIYVDDMFDGQGRGRFSGMWCHMWSDESDEELIEFGKRIGLKESWLQTQNPRFHHFDLRKNKRNQALEAGAKYMNLREWIAIQREHIKKYGANDV